jgi:hypothetical protein
MRFSRETVPVPRLSLLRLVIATIPPGRSPPSRKAVSHPRTIWGNFTRNSASQSVLRSIHVTQRQGSFIANSASQTLAARQCHTRHSYGWTPMPTRTFTRAAGVSPPWVSKPRLLQLQCNEFRISRSHRMHPHGGFTPPALVLQFERLPTKKRFLRCTYAHPVKSAVRQPAVG